MLTFRHKHYSHRGIIELVIAILFLGGGLFLAYMAYSSARLHHQLDSSIDELQASLKRSGIQSNQSRGCGSAYTEFGPNAKVCGIALSSEITANTANSAYEALTKYASVVDGTDLFNSKSNLPKAIVDKDNLPFGYLYYRENKTQKVCSVDYNYQSDKALIHLGFSCDYNTWFSDNF